MFFDDLFDNFDPFDTHSYRHQTNQSSSLFGNDDRSIILRKILNDEYNYMCFDCHRETRTLDYFDLKNGIFLCYNCAQKHTKLPKEITQPMTGNISSLKERDLLLLYFGGNQNLFEFIRRNYPLLENMNINNMYATKAMDYYRKMLRAKAYDEPEPDMPRKREAYHSIYQKKVNPQKKNNYYKNIRSQRLRDREDDDNIFSQTFFGDDLFNRNKRKQRENEREENEYFGLEPADIRKEENEKDDTKMEIEKEDNNEKSQNINDSNDSIETEEEEKPKESQFKRESNFMPINNRIDENQTIVEENKTINDDNICENPITINQIGEFSLYPDAKEIDGMDCE